MKIQITIEIIDDKKNDPKEPKSVETIDMSKILNLANSLLTGHKQTPSKSDERDFANPDGDATKTKPKKKKK